jgi:hypothetical protein
MFSLISKSPLSLKEESREKGKRAMEQIFEKEKMEKEGQKGEKGGRGEEGGEGRRERKRHPEHQSRSYTALYRVGN